jgi:hypothetical protein
VHHENVVSVGVLRGLRGQRADRHGGLACLEEMHVDPDSQTGGDGSEQSVPDDRPGRAVPSATRAHRGVCPGQYSVLKWSGTAAARVTVRAYNSEPGSSVGDHVTADPGVLRPVGSVRGPSHERADAHRRVHPSADKETDMVGHAAPLTRGSCRTAARGSRAINQSDVIVPLSDPRPGFRSTAINRSSAYTYRGGAARCGSPAHLNNLPDPRGVINHTTDESQPVPMSIASELSVAAQQCQPHQFSERCSERR